MVHLAFDVLKTAQGGDKSQELGGRQKGRRGLGFRHNADVGFEVLWICHGVDAQHLDAPDAWPELPGQELDEGGFPRPVGTEDAEELSLVNADVKRVQGHEIPVTLPNVLGVDEELTVGHASYGAVAPYEHTSEHHAQNFGDGTTPF